MHSLWERASVFLGLSDAKPRPRAGEHASMLSERSCLQSVHFGPVDATGPSSTNAEEEVPAAQPSSRFVCKQLVPEPQVAPSSEVLEQMARMQAVLTEAPALDGGRQGLKGIEDQMTSDSDGDRAHGFIIVDRQPERPTGG